MNKLNVVLISYEFPPVTAIGGIGSYMYHMSLYLTAKGHNVTVFSANPYATELSVVNYPYCVNYLVPSDGNEDFREKVLIHFDSFFKKNNVDFIESPEVGACAILIKEKFPQIPLIVKMHTPGVLITKISNTYQPLLSKLRFVIGALVRGKIDFKFWDRVDKNKSYDLEYRICTLAEYLVSPSTALKNWAVRYWELPEKKIQVIGNPFVSNDELLSFPLVNRSKTICFIGKLTILKGMKTFTPAIKTILLNNPDYNLVIVGRDEFLDASIPSMKEWMLSRLLSVKDRVIFTGPISKEKVFEVLSYSQVCIVPSLWENYPNVILEAMAAGCALAVSNVGGIPELVENDRNGLLFNPLNISSIVFTVQILLKDENRRLRIAEVAWQMISNSQYSQRLNDELDKFYFSIKK